MKEIIKKNYKNIIIKKHKWDILKKKVLDVNSKEVVNLEKWLVNMVVNLKDLNLVHGKYKLRIKKPQCLEE